MNSTASHAGPDPAMIGLPTEDDGSRDDPLLGQNMVSCTHYEHDVDALERRRTASSRLRGSSPTASWPTAGAVAVTERLGTTSVTFPSNHGGFLGSEYGQTGDPDAFAAALREVLDGQA